MLMHLSILPIGSDLLVSYEDHLYQRLLRYAMKSLIVSDVSYLVYM